ncbi:PIN domain-containing protein [Gordonia sp. HY285]|uniref:PIN domain-containing protein n=1 Tax=Gordonia liuliyuniae TaxID=2911517 RepID=UPI001F25E952|nr:PIN domain-containing protein [Gordonia liuliyuniae]MCF8612144.1 PIN domain-containing protein [Gordonia liuliyuniae]
MAGFRVVLDACVLVPIYKVDLLLTFAEQQAYFPLWSDRIMDETVRGMHRATKGRVSEERARARVKTMNDAFEDACVEGWEPLEAAIAGMPDPDDRHVVAAAVRGHASAIVTDNISDFPNAVLEPLGLQTRSSDRFLLDLVHRDPARAVACVAQTANKRRNPPVTTEAFLEALAASGAKGFVREITPYFESGS